jgi:DNA-binding MarR family transcriptional regulator
MVVVATEDVPSSRDYRRLLALRTGLRLFLRWSEAQAKAQGLTPTQHQLLLAIRGHPDPHGPTIGEIAEYLVIRHNSAVGLVDRAAAAGLVVREVDSQRAAVVHVRCTELGTARLDALSRLHAAELSRLTPTMDALWHALDDGPPGTG